jgi:hypothetical protein
MDMVTPRNPFATWHLTIFVALVLGSSGCSGLPVPITITVPPANQSVSLLQRATFKVTAAGSGPVAYQWQRNGADIPGATSPEYTTARTTMADDGAEFRVSVSNPRGPQLSAPATLTVGPGIDVPTYHYENMRLGQDLSEKLLTPALVNQTTFGKLGEFVVDGLVDAQPLYLSNVTIPNVGARNVLYVATEHGSVFAFDADSVNGNTAAYLWKTSTLLPNESPSDDRDCNSVTPEIGVTATPVIDRNRGAIYLVATSKDATGNYYQRLHALDLTTGKELLDGPTTITATYPSSGINSSNGNVTFVPKHYLERAALLEVNGNIYTTWASHCDLGSYSSWVIAYSADTLQQTSVLNLVPNGEKGGIWMSGAGPAADAAGNIYIILGNGDFDTATGTNGLPLNGNCGNCFVKLSSSPLSLLDYFTPWNTVSESDQDYDLGSGGPMLLPDVIDSSGNTRHLAIGAGKDVKLYVVDRDNMGKFSASTNNIYQELDTALSGIVFSKPAFFNGTVYYGSSSDAIKAFPVAGGKLSATPSSVSPNKFPYPGTTPTISANGTTNGIVWAVWNTTTASLFAFDATNLANILYVSSETPNSRDDFSGNKFITPVVANGNVYVGTPNTVAVFGLLP